MKTRPFLFSLLAQIAALRVALLFLFHAIVFTGCFVFAFLLRFDFAIPPAVDGAILRSLPLVVGIQLLVGFLFGFYRGWWRYVGMADVVRLVFGLTVALATNIALWYGGVALGLAANMVHTPRSVLVTDWAFSLLTLFGTRVLVRLGQDRLRPRGDDLAERAKRVLIIGAGDAGETLAREIEHRPQLGMKIVSFVDDHRGKWGSQIRGIKVVGPIADVGTIADELGADEALIAIPSASGKRLREIIHHLGEADLRFTTIPGIDRLVSGQVHISQLRPVNVEDLLRRERVDLPGDPVRQLFRGKRVMITGAGGTIGSELSSQILEFEPEQLVLVERSEYALYECRKRLSREAPWMMHRATANLADIRDTAAMEALLDKHAPQIVLHAAAHKHVPLGEENPPEYVRNNTLATRALAESCQKHGVERFVFISTDKAINPTSVMGATKRAAEVMLLDVARATDMKVTVVRFGNVIGSSGSVIPLFMEQIAAGGPVTVTHPDVTRYFLRTSEAVSLVLQAATLGDGGDIFMLDMGEPIKIVDLARDLIQLANQRQDDIPIVFTGMRPGEKLFEELRLHGETMRPTKHPQIVITELPQPDHAFVASAIERLDAATTTGVEPTLTALRSLVPEFVVAAVEAEAPPRSSGTAAPRVPVAQPAVAIAR